MIDATKLDDLLKQLSELMGGVSKDKAQPEKALDRKGHKVTVMTLEMGKQIKLPKAKKKEKVGEEL